MPRFAFSIICLLLPALAGCAGKPTTYLMLTPAPPAQNVPPAQNLSAPGAPVAVSHVQIPPVLDRTQYTTTTGTATLHVAGKARWAAPLGGLVQSALARDLAALLPATQVLMPGDPVPPAGVRQVQVTLQTFMADSAGQVTLDADWTIMAPDGQRVLAQNRFHDTLAGPARPGGEAETMSTLLGRLAAAIAQAMAQ